MGASLAAIGEAGSSLVARIARFDDLWVLEAPADSVARIEALWSPRGSLVRDISGTPLMQRGSTLVGARPHVWAGLDLRGDTGSSIAILDSGMDTAHDDLGDPDEDDEGSASEPLGDPDDWVDAAALGWPADPGPRVVGWHDVTDDLPTARGPWDLHRHGTALAGVAAGSGELDANLSGIAPAARLVPVKFYNFEGRWNAWASDFLLAVDWLLPRLDELRVRAVLVATAWPAELELRRATDALLAAGVPVVCAAGNDPTAPPAWPARLPGVLSVGATDVQGRLAAASSAGAGTVRGPDLVAPGGSAGAPGTGLLTCDNDPVDSYRERHGSSLAAAHVAGGLSLLAQALEETGRPWRGHPGQVRWLGDILRATAVETGAAEPGAAGVPPVERQAGDRFEGHGLLQLPAAIGALRRVHWPGDREEFTLGAPASGLPGSFAARVPLFAQEAVEFLLLPPTASDFDLQLYRDDGDSLRGVAISPRAVAGQPEQFSYTPAQMGWYVVVVRRVSGVGSAVLRSSPEVNGRQLWPLRAGAAITAPPTLADIDGDGPLEVLLTNNVASQPDGHSWFAWRADGEALPGFRYSFFTPGQNGEMGGSAMAPLGGSGLLVASGQWGALVGRDRFPQTGQPPTFLTELDPGRPLSDPVVVGEGVGARILVGSSQGVHSVGPDGVPVALWPVAAGVRAAPAAGDVDGDGPPELLFVDQASQLHLRDLDGQARPGWPRALPLGGAPGAPVFLGAPPSGARPAIATTLAGGAAELLLFAPDGSTRPGFPVSLSRPGGGSIVELSPLAASPLVRGGPPVLLVASFQVGSGGGGQLWLHVVGADGTESVWPGPVASGPRLAGATFQYTRRALATPVVAQLASPATAEVLVAWGAAWEETRPGQRLRYGSRQAIAVFGDGAHRAGLDLDLGDGRQLAPQLQVLAPAARDLDLDGRVELLVARGNALYRAGGRVPWGPADWWALARGDSRRSACGGCDPPPATAAPPGVGAAWLALVPNPANPRSELRLAGHTPGPALFELLDARGRRLRAWTRVLPAGEHREPLFGHDGGGAPVASGVYRLRVRWEGGATSAPFTLVR